MVDVIFEISVFRMNSPYFDISCDTAWEHDGVQQLSQYRGCPPRLDASEAPAATSTDVNHKLVLAVSDVYLGFILGV